MKMFDHMEEGADFLEKMTGNIFYGLWVVITLPFSIIVSYFTEK